jgi:hypothetical protein
VLSLMVWAATLRSPLAWMAGWDAAAPWVGEKPAPLSPLPPNSNATEKSSVAVSKKGVCSALQSVRALSGTALPR